MNSAESDFRRLIDEMAQGSEEAAWNLTEIYTPHILRAVRALLPSRIRSKVDSRDFVQSVWASILLKRSRLDQFQRPEQFIGYVAAMARHKVIDMHRHFLTEKKDINAEVAMPVKEHMTSAANVEKRLPMSKEPTPSQVAVARETWEQMVRRRPTRDQRIISMRIKGLTYVEIADRLTVSEKTVQRSLHRMLNDFQG